MKPEVTCKHLVFYALVIKYLLEILFYYFFTYY